MNIYGITVKYLSPGEGANAQGKVGILSFDSGAKRIAEISTNDLRATMASPQYQQTVGKIFEVLSPKK